MHKDTDLNFIFLVDNCDSSSLVLEKRISEKKNNTLVCQDSLIFAEEWYIM